MKILLTLLLFVGLLGCQKKTAQKVTADDFEALSGKGTLPWQYVITKEDRQHVQIFSKIYDLRKALLNVANASYRIPPIIHFIWIGPAQFPRASVQNVRSWISKHPEWTVNFWTDRQRPLPCPGMQMRFISELPLQMVKECLRTSDNFAEKADVLRGIILSEEGGVYVDHDVKCFKSFDALNKAYDFYCGIDMPFTSSLPSCVFPTNNLIGAKPHHPILEKYTDSLPEKWEAIREDYPGADRDSMLNRILHRTFFAFGESVKMENNRDENRDIVFPAYYFDAPNDDLAIYARHTYAGTYHEKETHFEKTVRERLMYLSKKSNRILLYFSAFSGLNLIGLLLLFRKLKTRN